MNLQPWQQRVVQEYDELTARLDRFLNFIESAKFDALDDAEKERLRRQLVAMRDYKIALADRMKAFA